MAENRSKINSNDTLFVYIDITISETLLKLIKNKKSNNLIKNNVSSCYLRLYSLINQVYSSSQNFSKSQKDNFIITALIEDLNFKIKDYPAKIYSLQTKFTGNNLWVQDIFTPNHYAKNDSIFIRYNEPKLKNALEIIKKIKYPNQKFTFNYTDKKNIQGGNILIVDSNLAFIGKDFKSEINIDTLKDYLKVKNIIFIGCRNKCLYDINNNQPIYHLDLFMNLGEITNYNDTTCINVYFSKAEELYTSNSQAIYKWNTDLEDIIVSLQEDINTLNTGVKNTNQYYKLNINTIPLSIINNIAYSYSNCVVESTDTSIFFYVPYYNNVGYNTDYLSKIFHTKVKNIVYPIFEETNGKYYGFDRLIKEQRGSLHCIVKVFSRYN